MIAAVPATPALAWGDKEQGFVAGVTTAIIVDELLKNNRKARLYDQGYSKSPVYREPRYVEPRYDEPRHTTSVYSTPAARAFQSYSLRERKAIQRNLRAYGYYRGGIDGVRTRHLHCGDRLCPRRGPEPEKHVQRLWRL